MSTSSVGRVECDVPELWEDWEVAGWCDGLPEDCQVHGMSDEVSSRCESDEPHREARG